ncbi:Protein sym1 [Erysiphe neolycopersici]|uniref:Protein sym1 n=1 Tax=Erysiphe neolycopersici TaxID=212602 RepID=A0A420I2C2_9PEZI|nr:Protein sym1 [Erysiphe neolycopersici]
MVFDMAGPRLRLLTRLNSKCICGGYSILHAIVLLLEIAMVFRLMTKFNSYYGDRPVLTMMVTNAILSGIADTVAQSITAIRAATSKTIKDSQNSDSDGIEFQDLDRKNSTLQHDAIIEPRLKPPPFDFERLMRFIAYGFMMAPPQFKWFQFLSKIFPISKESGLLPALKMVAFDQMIYAPIGVATFFTVMTVAEGGDRRAVSIKLRDMFIPTLKANYMIWPLVQMVNFRLMPIRFQLPFVSTVGIAWTTYLSLSNSNEGAEIRSVPQSPNIRLS